jgi:molybdopterin-binding protein
MRKMPILTARTQPAERRREKAQAGHGEQSSKVTRDSVMAQVEIQAGPHRFVSLLSREAADELGLQPGMLAVAAVKATNVSVEIPTAAKRVLPEHRIRTEPPIFCRLIAAGTRRASVMAARVHDRWKPRPWSVTVPVTGVASVSNAGVVCTS